MIGDLGNANLHVYFKMLFTVFHTWLVNENITHVDIRLDPEATRIEQTGQCKESFGNLHLSSLSTICGNYSLFLVHMKARNTDMIVWARFFFQVSCREPFNGCHRFSWTFSSSYVLSEAFWRSSRCKSLTSIEIYWFGFIWIQSSEKPIEAGNK